MKQTPAHSIVNNDLLSLIPSAAQRIVEVGCMHGALARAYRTDRPGVHYVGIDIDPEYAKVAEIHCSRTLAGDIEALDTMTFQSLFPSDCWIFGDCLEHLRDPWNLLRRIRLNLDPNGWLLACIPNAQHWSVQVRLASGKLFYEDSGLLDRTHLRWLTRITMIDMFQSTGWRIENAISRTLSTPLQEAPLRAIAAMAELAGLEPTQSVQDAIPFQYIFVVRPA